MPTTAPVIDLSILTRDQGFVLQGDVADDLAGWSVSSAGDVNGDGIDDLIVGAPWNDDGGFFAGAAYVVYGRARPFRSDVDLGGLTADTGLVIQGDEGGSFAVFGDRAGISVSSAGDVNGDDIDDLIVGASTGDDGGLDAGEAYVIYGRVGTGTGRVDLTGLTAEQGFVIQGAGGGPFMLNGGRAGGSVSDAGDVNGDGIDDVIVGASLNNDGGAEAGKAYVIYGQAGDSRGRLDLGTLTPSQGFAIQGDLSGDQAGNSVSGAGDVNGDGIDDLIVGAPYGNDGGLFAGEAYVIYGQVGATRNTLDLSALTTAEGFVIQGDLTRDRAGWSVSNAGDVNSDGIDDLIVGAVNENSGGRGEAYVIYGKTGTSQGTLDLSTLNAAQGFIIQGDEARYDGIGFSVSSAGDVNGDGFDDLILGLPFDNDGGALAGGAYVVYGKAGVTRGTIDLPTLTADEGFFIQGDKGGTVINDFGDRAGFSVSSAGDVNGDGIDDLILGAVGLNDGTDAGQAYVIYGARPTEAVERVGTLIGQAIFGGALDDTLRGLGGSDTIDGGAGADLLSGGNGLDTLDYSRAGSGVTVSLATGTGTRGQAAGDRVSGFERILGSTRSDEVTGDDFGNVLSGLGGADLLIGGGGGDRLTGGARADTLSGGLGSDVFVFDKPGEGGDQITDFTNAGRTNNDSFSISAAGFGGGLVGGGVPLAAAQFQTRADTLAQDADDRFIFNTTDTTLWYDSNGNAAGGLSLVADLQAGAVVTYLDILLV